MTTFNPVGPYERHPVDNEKNLQANHLIDSICRGEISAIEAYEQVIEKLDKSVEIKKMIKDFYSDHKYALQFWKAQSLKNDHDPQDSSGVWGKTVEAIVGMSKIFGEVAALKALLEGEEHGLKEYQSMLESPVLTQEQRDEIIEKFIPCQKRHIHRLDSLIRAH